MYDHFSESLREDLQSGKETQAHGPCSILHGPCQTDLEAVSELERRLIEGRSAQEAIKRDFLLQRRHAITGGHILGFESDGSAWRRGKRRRTRVRRRFLSLSLFCYCYHEFYLLSSVFFALELCLSKFLSF